MREKASGQDGSTLSGLRRSKTARLANGGIFCFVDGIQGFGNVLL